MAKTAVRGQTAKICCAAWRTSNSGICTSSTATLGHSALAFSTRFSAVRGLRNQLPIASAEILNFNDARGTSWSSKIQMGIFGFFSESPQHQTLLS